MVEVETVTGKVTIDASGAVQGYQQAGGAAKTFGAEATTAGDKATTADGKVVTSQKNVETATKATTSSFKDAVFASAELATSGLALYNSFDNIEKAQLRVDRANKNIESSQLTVNKAQADYNAAVKEYGVDSEQAAAAADKLSIATQGHENAVESAKIAQDNLNETTMKTAITILPALITGVDGAVKAYKTIKDLDMIGHFKGIGGAISGLGSEKVGIIGGAITGMAALGFLMAGQSAKSAEEKKMYDTMAGAMVALTAVQWGLNIAKAVGVALTPVVGLIIVGAAVAAGVGMYALAQSYGSTPGSSPESQMSGATGSASSNAVASKGEGSTGYTNTKYVENSLYSDKLAAFGVSGNDSQGYRQGIGNIITNEEADFFKRQNFGFNNADQTWHKNSGGVTNYNTITAENESVADYLAKKINTGAI